MIDWLFAETLEVDTRQAVTRWWVHRRPSAAAPIPDGLVEDLQTARLALDEGLQRRLRDVAIFLTGRERRVCDMRIARLDPRRILSHARAAPWLNAATVEQEGANRADRERIAVLKERARRRERLVRPRFPSAARRRLRDLARGRGGLAAVLQDDDACRMLRFGAMLCDLVEIASVEDAEPDPDDVRALLAQLPEADTRRAAQAVLNDPLVGTDDRGRPAEQEIAEFVRAVVEAVELRVGYRFTPTITRRAARSPNWDDLPGPDIQLVLDLLACHAPSKTAEAIADLIKGA